MVNPYKSPEYVDPVPGRKISLLLAFVIVYYSIATYGRLRAVIDGQPLWQLGFTLACGIGTVLMVWHLTSKKEE
jgi:hypothetical protein